MASVDKIKVGSTSYNISPAKDGTLTGFTSNDAASPTAWSAADAITTSDSNATIFSKITTMIKNVRWLYSKLGTTDFSATGQSTVTGALSALQSGLNGKAASSHSHGVDQLPVSSSQTNSNSYIPTSALVYSMQQQITSLNDAIASASSSLKTATVSVNSYRLSFNSSWNTVYSCFGQFNNNRYLVIGIPNNSSRIIYLYYPSVNGTDSEGNTLNYLSTGPSMTNSFYASTVYVIYS